MFWKKHFEFVIITPRHSRMLRFAMPVWILTICGILLGVVSIVGAYGLKTGFQEHQKISHMEELQRTYNKQQLKLRKINNQLLSVEQQMNHLRELDHKLRLMTNLHLPREDNLYGLGGSETPLATPLKEINLEELSVAEILERDIERLNNLATLQKDSFHNLKSHLSDNKDLLDRTPYLWPVKGFISSTYGNRRDPFTGEIRMHHGLDVVSPEGTPIRATADGIVTVNSKDPGMGNMLVLDHGYGIITRYGHTQVNLVNEGQRVRRGDVIALVGSTGRSTGPHLHYEILMNDVPINPFKVLIGDVPKSSLGFGPLH